MRRIQAPRARDDRHRGEAIKTTRRARARAAPALFGRCARASNLESEPRVVDAAVRATTTRASTRDGVGRARARSADAASATTPTTADATSTMFDLGKFGARGADARTTRGTAVPAARGAGGGDDAVDASGAGDARARARATRATEGGKEDGLLEETGRGTLNPFDMDCSERETVRLKPGMTRGQFALLLASECALAVGLFCALHDDWIRGRRVLGTGERR